MTAKSKDRTSTPNFMRLCIALSLALLLLFPDGVAMGQSCTAGVWTTSTVNLPAPIETFAAAVATTSTGTRLYVAGGYNAQTHTGKNTVSYVKLNADGSLDATNGFTTQTMPAPISRDLCGVVNNGYLYVIGGVDYTNGGSGSTTKTIRRAHINTNGSLASWSTQASALPNILQLHGSVVLGGYLYVIGGSTFPDDSAPSQQVTNKVYFSKIDPSNGSLTLPFSKGPTLVGDPANTAGNRYKTCPVVVGNRIYIAGGENGGGALQTVYYATQGVNGVLDGWTQASPLLSTDAAQAVVYNKGINLLGGDSNGHGVDWNTVYQGAISNTNPSSITWTTLTPLPGNVSRNAGATFSTFMYSIGGLIGVNTDSSEINCMKKP